MTEVSIFLYGFVSSVDDLLPLWIELARRSKTTALTLEVRSDYLFRGIGVPFVYPFADVEPTPGWLPYGQRGCSWCVPGAQLRCAAAIGGKPQTEKLDPLPDVTRQVH